MEQRGVFASAAAGKERLEPERSAEITRAHFDAVLFDLDGVLTDTASMHAACWKRVFDDLLEGMAKERNEPFRPFDVGTDYPQHVDGKARLDGVRDFLSSRGLELPQDSPAGPCELLSVTGIARRKDALFEQALSRGGIRVYPGSLRWLHYIRGAGLRTAVVSASHHCAEILRSAGIAGLFEVRVDGNTADDRGLQGKPAPDMFLEAARELEVEAPRAVVIEDALAGVQAGRAGGFGLTVGVARRATASALAAAGADRVVADLAELLP